MAYRITDKCVQCGACASYCPSKCISSGSSKYVIDANKCIECGTCASVCPVGAPQRD